MIARNEAIFTRLDDFCAIRFDQIRNAGKRRFITTNEADKAFLKKAVRLAELSLAPGIKLAHYSFEGQSILVCSGLEISDPPQGLKQTELGGGILTVFLSEQRPSPSASTAEIRNIVEVDDLDANPAFQGSAVSAIAGLFPNIQVFIAEEIAKEESFRAFFLLAASSRPLLQLKDDQFIETIRSLAELSPTAIPYETLCRSILDSDPSSMFLALYRCLEALYAYSHWEELKATLKLSIAWTDLAVSLEETLGWRPHEEQSLSALLDYAAPEKLRKIAEAINEPIAEGARPNEFVAKRIYKFRNSVVHYRAFQQVAPHNQPDWERLTEALAVLIFDIYEKVSYVKTGQPSVAEQQEPPSEPAAGMPASLRRLPNTPAKPEEAQPPNTQQSSVRRHGKSSSIPTGIAVFALFGLLITWTIGERYKGQSQRF